MDYIIVILLVGLSGLFSGLTLGLLSWDKSELERKIELGDKRAKKVYGIRKNGNLLLCTLLLGNVAVNATLAIFLGNITSGVIGVLVSTGLIVVFGEIVPQAVCARYGLIVGAKTAWLVKIFIFIFYPVCRPLAWALDKILGEEMPIVYSKRELIKIIEEHEDLPQAELDQDEERIIKGALTFSDKKVSQIMTPKKKVFALQKDVLINDDLIRLIKKKGHTRVPVYGSSSNSVVGILYVKDLLGLNKEIKLDKICHQQKTLRVSQDMKLDELLNKFVKFRLHMAIVVNRQRECVGVITLEDVIEEVLKLEIVDETDKIV
jgi:metal transporter CNNM